MSKRPFISRTREDSRMLKLTVAMLAIALAGTASAAKWRDLRVDGTSEEAFAKSLEAFKEELSQARVYVLVEALKDIWTQGAKTADAEQREYTADEYYRQVDGLRYEEVVKYTDPTGDTAQLRYRQAKAATMRRYVSSGPANGFWQGESALTPVYGGISYRGGAAARTPGEY
jgi:hypothetical protein